MFLAEETLGTHSVLCTHISHVEFVGSVSFGDRNVTVYFSPGCLSFMHTF